MILVARTRAPRRGLRKITALDLFLMQQSRRMMFALQGLRVSVPTNFSESPATSEAGFFVWVIKNGPSPEGGRQGRSRHSNAPGRPAHNLNGIVLR